MSEAELKQRRDQKIRDEKREQALRHAHAREKAYKHYGDESRAKE